MRRPDHQSLIAATDKLYAAALDPSKWRDFLSEVVPLFDADNAFLCRFDVSAARRIMSASISSTATCSRSTAPPR
jgi:hypothetical protein